MHCIAVVSGTVESFHKRRKKSKRETRIASCSQVRHTHRKQSSSFKNRPWKSAVFTSRAISDGHGACTLENNMQHEYYGSGKQRGSTANQKARAVVNHRTGRQSGQSESRSSCQSSYRQAEQPIRKQEQLASGGQWQPEGRSIQWVQGK